MGILDTLNRIFFNLTYNEKAEKAYSEQRKESETAIQNLQATINDYRKQRDTLITQGKLSDYVATFAGKLITMWEEWIQKNANLPEGDYVAKKTEVKTLWEIVLSLNTLALEIKRIPSFLDFFKIDKDLELSIDQKKSIDKLKEDATKFYESMNDKSGSEIIAKRDEFNTRFGEILKTLDPKVLTPEDPKSLLQGINDSFYNNYVGAVKKKEKVEQNTFSLRRGTNTVKEYTYYFIEVTLRLVFALIFAVVVANDVIGRPGVFRVYFFIFTFILISRYPFSYILVFFYYLYRYFTGTSPVIFSMLPLYPKEYGSDVKPSFFSFYFDAHKKDNFAMTQEFEYFSSLAAKIEQTLTKESFKKMINSESS